MKFFDSFKKLFSGKKEDFLNFSNTGEDPDIVSNEGLSWEELRKQYSIPQWYSDAKFGIWAHWGAQSVPEVGGGWYARHMYQPDEKKARFGKNAYPHHLKTYGHPSEFGYKDVANLWKADKLDTDSLLKYFTEELGAKFFVALANHHDNFDNWDSKYHPWNSVNVGPKKDIIGEFSRSAKKLNLPFGVSIHNDRYMDWWLSAFGSDSSGPKKGVPYDGHLTKEDGVGKWWEGLDPQELYGLSPEQRTEEYMLEVKRKWLKRHKQLLTSYELDLVWFDGWNFPIDNYGKEAFRTYLNHNLETRGNLDVCIIGKNPKESLIVKDIECGVTSDIHPKPWSSVDTYTHWFYKTDDEPKFDSRLLIEYFIDVVSKNGIVLFSVEMLPDGTIPEDEKPLLDDFGGWLKLNGVAIYSTKPWKIFGDNITSGENVRNVNVTDAKAAKKKKAREQFNNRTRESPPYTHEEVRFTMKGDNIFVFVLNPAEGSLEIPSLGLHSEFNTKKIQSIELLGCEESINFEQSDLNLRINVPKERPNGFSSVFKVSFI